eukprot:4783363-Prymnesium_polylepis.2
MRGQMRRATRTDEGGHIVDGKLRPTTHLCSMAAWLAWLARWRVLCADVEYAAMEADACSRGMGLHGDGPWQLRRVRGTGARCEGEDGMPV